MYRNERYEDNVVLKREALQELLTNIRNYPVIDIDYLEETEIDRSYTPEGNTVPEEATYWNRYTGGVPCIRITYGDPETDKGKIALAGANARANIEKLKKELANLTTTLIQQEEKRARWVRIKEENERLKEKKIQEITIYEEKRQTLNENDASEITRKYTDFRVNLETYSESIPLLGSLVLLNEYPIDLDRVQLKLDKGDSTNTTVISSEGENYYYFPNTLPNLVIPESAFGENNNTITLYVLNDYLNVLNQISTARQQIQQYCSEAGKGEAPAVQNEINDIQNRSIAALNALELVFRDYNTWLTGGFIIDPSDETSVDVAQYKGGQIIHGTRTESTYATIQAYIKQYINSEIQDKITRAGKKIDALKNEITSTKSQIESKKTEIKNAQDSITVDAEQENGIKGYKYVKVGSNIQWNKNVSFSEIDNPDLKQQKNGHFRVTINGHTYEIGIKGFESSTNDSGIIMAGAQGENGSLGTAQINPAVNTDSSLGTEDNPWDNAYITTGRFDTINIKMGNSYTDLSNYINNAVTYDDSKALTITNKTDGINESDGDDGNLIAAAANGITGKTTASINTLGGIYAKKNIYAARVFNAVFNDYAECRSTINLTPGHVVIDQDDGSLTCSFARLQPGAQVISDTYGHLMGGTDKAKTPIAVAGRVLVYTYQPRENYHAGMAVCSAPDGTVDIMTREEIRDYPDCIIGIVSEIPQYETWGSGNVKVDGRIWIKVK